jgi:trehalose/maltose hydrolase-like predicted phosphorylase
MSYGIHTVVAARLGQCEEAYRQWSDGWRKFSSHPELEFREHQAVPSGYFLTGAASQIDGVLYGFLGLRLDDQDPGDVPWKLQLKSKAWVSLTPSLPKQWASVRCTLWFDGRAYNVYVEGRSLRVDLKGA